MNGAKLSKIYIVRSGPDGEYRSGAQFLAMMRARNLVEWKANPIFNHLLETIPLGQTGLIPSLHLARAIQSLWPCRAVSG